MKRITFVALALAFFAVTGTQPATAGNNNGPKITICHYPENNPNAVHEISIDLSTWPTHQAHGDWVGACHWGSAIG